METTKQIRKTNISKNSLCRKIVKMCVTEKAILQKVKIITNKKKFSQSNILTALIVGDDFIINGAIICCPQLMRYLLRFNI